MSVCPLCKGTGQYNAKNHHTPIQHRIKEMVEAGMTYRAIAAATGLKSPSTVYYHVKKMKITPFKKELITDQGARDALAQSDIPD